MSSAEKSPKRSPKEEELLVEAREHVIRAADILKSFGPSGARVGWLLEDALTYLDEPDAEIDLSEIENLIPNPEKDESESEERSSL